MLDCLALRLGWPARGTPEGEFPKSAAETAGRSLGNGVRKNGVRNRVRIDDVESILKFRIGFPFGENSAGFCKSV